MFQTTDQMMIMKIMKVMKASCNYCTSAGVCLGTYSNLAILNTANPTTHPIAKTQEIHSFQCLIVSTLILASHN